MRVAFWHSPQRCIKPAKKMTDPHGGNDRKNAKLTEQTIRDFGDQWKRFTDNSGYYGSRQLFEDIVGPLLKREDIRGKIVADIGSGTGRIVQMLLDSGAANVTALEPSKAYDVLVQRFQQIEERVICRNVKGEAIADLGPFDLIFSIGVLHHIPDPDPVVLAALGSLKPGGAFVAWVYGKEGNLPYLWIAKPLRLLTKKLPDPIVDALVRLLDLPLSAYIKMCGFIALPMRGYMCDVLGRMSKDKRRLIIFDQLNPAYAKYYSQDEARILFERAGFKEIVLHHRHAYSWTILGRKQP